MGTFITLFKKTLFIATFIFGSLGIAGLTQAIEAGNVPVVCYKSAIKEPLTFYGNSGDKFTLNDGSQWKILSKDTYEYIPYRYRDIVICPSLEKIIIGYRALTVVALKP